MPTKRPLTDLQDDACISELAHCVASLLERYPSITVFAAMIGGLEVGARELQRTGHLTDADVAQAIQNLKRRTRDALNTNRNRAAHRLV